MIERDVRHLEDVVFDVLVIGGGIAGACTAWEASQRGLRVALVERTDFGGATSANSLKTVHGGLRYLQDGNLPQVRKMVRERQAFLRIAPHLVQPLPCIMPTYSGRLKQSKLALGIATKLNDLISLDRNQGVSAARHLPGGKLLSRRTLLTILPELETGRITGAMLWHDAQMVNSERLLLAFVLSAAEAGAIVANYVKVTRLLSDGKKVIGAEAEDTLSGERLTIRARVTINAAGPWVDGILTSLSQRPSRRQFHLSAAVNVVTRQLFADYAVALDAHLPVTLTDGTSETRRQVLFISPWRNHSIIGTYHVPYVGDPDDRFDLEEAVRRLLSGINEAYPAAKLTPADIEQIHYGHLPSEPDARPDQPVQLVRSEQITDHSQEDGIEGLITAVAVKYTTARYLAEKTIDIVLKKLGQPHIPSVTREKPLVGGAIKAYGTFVEQALAERPEDVSARTMKHWLESYGTRYTELVNYASEDPGWNEPLGPGTLVTRAEVRHAVRAEMAQTLADVIDRRTNLASDSMLREVEVRNCLAVLAEEMGWDDARCEDEFYDFYSSKNNVKVDKKTIYDNKNSTSYRGNGFYRRTTGAEAR